MAARATPRRIAILGSTSHLALGLIHSFCAEQVHELILFARSPERTASFLRELMGRDRATVQSLASFADSEYDVVINCIGAGNPAKVKALGSGIFRLTETFDNQVLDYLASHPATLYINLSSGAVYGTNFAEPASDRTTASIGINNLRPEDWYGVAKLNAEAKHRSFQDLRIVDIRIFAYFSKFIDLQARFLLTDAINCILKKCVLETSPEDIVRDYIHPEDLHSLIVKCIETRVINDVFDACSREPVSKFQLLDFLSRQYSLRYTILENARPLNVTGIKMNYYSTSTKARSIGYAPQYTSLDCIKRETEAILTREGATG